MNPAPGRLTVAPVPGLSRKFTQAASMIQQIHQQQLRTPRERVGTLSRAALPPPTVTDDLDETALLGALRARDERSFEKLLELYYDSMLRVAIGFVRSREAAEEVVQDTWLAVLSGLHRFEGRSSLRTWIFRILANRARTRARRDARLLPFSTMRGRNWSAGERAHAAVEVGVSSESPLPWHGSGEEHDGAEERLLARELTDRIQAAIGQLSSSQREVITLRDLEGWSAMDVCRRLGLSEGNQRVILHRARLRVRDALRDYLEPSNELQTDA